MAAQSAPARGAVDGRIAFVRGGQIFTVDESLRQRRRLTTTGVNARPHFSPNGRRISYIHENPGGQRDVWVMRANGSHQGQVTHLGDVTEAQWSPNGKWLAFGPVVSKIRSTAPHGDPIVLKGVVDQAGEPRPLTETETLDWSPAGGHIAYYSHDYPDSPDNYLLDLDLAAETVDVIWSVGAECCGLGYFGDPAYSPDGESLGYSEMIYAPWDGERPTRPHVEIDAYPSRLSRGFPEERGDKDPEFSPSGGRVVMSHVDSGKPSVVVADLDGSNRHLVAHGHQPDWQPR